MTRGQNSPTITEGYTDRKRIENTNTVKQKKNPTKKRVQLSTQYPYSSDAEASGQQVKQENSGGHCYVVKEEKMR